MMPRFIKTVMNNTKNPNKMGECLLSSTSDRFDNIEIQMRPFS